MRKLFCTLCFILFFLSFGYAQNIQIASYNVENLFDLNNDSTEYQEYIPYTKSAWNKKAYDIKLRHTAQVLSDLDAHIVALQEIESVQALEDLQKLLPKYSYKVFSKNSNSAVGLAVLSQYPIEKIEKISFKTKVNRPILKTTIMIDDQPLILFNNHWASKRHKESQRVNFAMNLKEYLEKLPANSDYILLGDFNSNYNEFETLVYDKRINDTNAHTGINHVLNTIIDQQIITKENILNQTLIAHYNTWYELPTHLRFSNLFRKEKQTPDNILLSKGLFDNKNFSYVNKSFQVFKPAYLYSNNTIHRWKITNKTHQHKGYSDHLPIMVSVTLKSYESSTNDATLSGIKSLYNQNQTHINTPIQNALVIYKDDNNAIIKDDSQRAIFLYQCAQELKLGYRYDLTIQEVKNFHGLMEVIKINGVIKKDNEANIKHYFTNGNTINLHDIQFQNEIITNIKGSYKNGYLYYNNNQKIRLYSKDKSLLPKNGQNITIINAHLGYFKNQAQLIIYKQSDFSVN